ncbi:MAG: DUF167 domain-containing protein [Patescibacteria group bacterium]
MSKSSQQASDELHEAILKEINLTGYLRVKVTPKSQQTEITGILEDKTVKIRIQAPPEKGKANKELIKYLSQEFKVPTANITILSGIASQLKLLKIKLS